MRSMRLVDIFIKSHQSYFEQSEVWFKGFKNTSRSKLIYQDDHQVQFKYDF